MRAPTIMRHASAFVPVLMSCAALATVGVHIALHGSAREADEGTAAHIWQLLVILQLPMIAFFVVRWLPQAPKQATGMLALQLGALLAALAPVYLLGL